MTWYFRIALPIACLIGWNSMLSADNTQKKDHDIKKIDDGVSVWVGPGWYGDVYFDDEDEYDEWNTMVWVGPGWYGGYWFDGSGDWDDWHGHHYHDENWQGHHGGGHGGHGGGGHGGHH